LDELVTLHKNIIFRQQESGYLGQLPHRRTVSVRDDRAKLVQCIVQVVHSPALTRVNIQPHAFPLTSRLRLRGAVQSRSCRSRKNYGIACVYIDIINYICLIKNIMSFKNRFYQIFITLVNYIF